MLLFAVNMEVFLVCRSGERDSLLSHPSSAYPVPPWHQNRTCSQESPLPLSALKVPRNIPEVEEVQGTASIEVIANNNNKVLLFLYISFSCVESVITSGFFSSPAYSTLSSATFPFLHLLSPNPSHFFFCLLSNPFPVSQSLSRTPPSLSLPSLHTPSSPCTPDSLLSFHTPSSFCLCFPTTPFTHPFPSTSTSSFFSLCFPPTPSTHPFPSISTSTSSFLSLCFPPTPSTFSLHYQPLPLSLFTRVLRLKIKISPIQEHLR